MLNTILALFAIILFAGTVIATEVAITVFNSVELTISRGFISGIFFFFFLSKEFFNDLKTNILTILITTLTSIYGFQIFLSKAMAYSNSVNSAIALILMPIFTSIVAVLVHKSKTNFKFWALSLSASILMISYISSNNTDNLFAIIYLSLASLSGAISYNYGSKIICSIGVKRFMAIASFSSLAVSILCCMPLYKTFNIDVINVVLTEPDLLFSLLYLGVIVQIIANSMWLKSLAEGNIPLLSQLQLLQTFFTIGLAYIFLHHQIKLADFLVTILLLIHIFYIKKSLQ